MSQAKLSHSKMLATRRRTKRRLKDLAVVAKREKKARNQNAKGAAAATAKE